MRLLIAIAAGLSTTVLLAYLGLVVFLLTVVGIPLGATPEPLRPIHYAVLLAIICGAALVGGRTAGRIVRSHRRLAVTTMSVILAVGALWGFSGPNNWPGWWGGAVAVAVVAGACGGFNSGIRRSTLTK